MTQFELQIIGLILIAFIIGVVIGYVLRTRIFPPVAAAGEGGGITLESRQERQPSSLLRGKGASAKGRSAAKTTSAKSSAAKGATAKSSSGNKAGSGASSGKTSAATKSQDKPSKPAQTSRDNLQEIKGIGAVLEKKLNALGIERFEQIAGWTESDIARIDETLNFRGRIEREQWVEQARELANRSGG